MTITIIIIAVTVLITLAGFNDDSIINKLILWPRYMDKPTEYYRFLTSGFIHADWNHLIFNMFTLYSFGGAIESFLGERFILLYLTGIIISSVPSYLKNRHNSGYRSLGASGGVSSVLFFSIYFSPWSKIGIMFIPVGIPCILFGVLYLVYCVIMSKRGQGNINHDAHLWGSLYGLFFAFMVDPTHGTYFINGIMNRGSLF